MKSINAWLDKIALKITGAVGSMWCAIIFTVLALTSLPSTIIQSVNTSNVAPLIQWVAQTFLQLVLLSIILKGQNIGADQMNKVIENINDNTTKTEALAERIEHILEIIEKDEEKKK
jgi:uncharacterized membrane protein